MRIVRSEGQTGNHATSEALHMAATARFLEAVKTYAIAEVAKLSGVEGAAKALEEAAAANEVQRQRNKEMAARMRFVRQYAAEKDWDPMCLTSDQMVEIRSQEGWIHP